MLIFKPNPIDTDHRTLEYLGDYGTSVEKAVLYNELRKGFNLFGKIQVPHFLVSKKGKAYTQNYNMNPNKSKGNTHSSIHTDEDTKSDKHSTVQAEPAQSSTQKVFKKFKNALEAFSFFGRHPWSKGTPFANWISQLTKTEEQAVKKYTGAYYPTINKYMRGQSKDSDFKPDELAVLKDTIQNITSAIAKSELTTDVELHRVMDAKDIHLFQNNPNNIYQDLAFISTSPVKGSFKPIKHKNTPLINIKIHVPKGKGRGAWLAPMSVFKKELELLLPPASKFVVTRCECVDGKNWEVDMDWTDEDGVEEVKKAMSTNDSVDVRMGKFMWQAGDFRILKRK